MVVRTVGCEACSSPVINKSVIVIPSRTVDCLSLIFECMRGSTEARQCLPMTYPALKAKEQEKDPID